MKCTLLNSLVAIKFASPLITVFSSYVYTTEYIYWD